VEGWKPDLCVQVERELAATYDQEAICKWWERSHTALNGKTPFAVIQKATTPGDAEILVELARNHANQ
jgi:hypothetical protein